MDERDKAGGAAGGGEASRAGRGDHRRPVSWSKKRKAAFLDQLATTCNVTSAARAAGVSPGSVYGLRRRDPAFVTAWNEALLLGYQMLETQLVAHALAGDGAGAAAQDDVDRPAPINVSLALTLLSRHRDGMKGKPHKGGPRLHVATREETNAAILRKLKIVEARYRPIDPERPALIDGRPSDGTGGEQAS